MVTSNSEPKQAEPIQRPPRRKNRLRMAFFIMMGGMLAIRLGGNLFSNKNSIGADSGQRPAGARRTGPTAIQPPLPGSHSQQDISIRSKADVVAVPPAGKDGNKKPQLSEFKDGPLFTMKYIDRQLGSALKLDPDDRLIIEKLRTDLLAQHVVLFESIAYKHLIEGEQKARKELTAAGVDVEKIKKAQNDIRQARARRKALTGGFDAELNFLLGVGMILSKEQLDRIWHPRRQARIMTRHMAEDKMLEERMKRRERKGRRERKKRVRDTEKDGEKE